MSRLLAFPTAGDPKISRRSCGAAGSGEKGLESNAGLRVLVGCVLVAVGCADF